MIDKTKFGNKISFLRKKAGLSQSELADKLNLSTQAVSKWECGTALPDIEILIELSWLFDISINSLLLSNECDELNENINNNYSLSENIKSEIRSKEQLNLISSISQYFTEKELLKIINELNKESLDIKLNIKSAYKQEETTNNINIPIAMLSKKALSELSSPIAESISNLIHTADIGINKISDLLMCPICRERLSLNNDDENTYFECCNNHKYFVEDGVIYFNTREIPGEQWSLTYRNYNHYIYEASYPVLPVYNRGEVYDEELKWREIEKRKPRIILDIASGTGTGIKYTLERIYWNCTVIISDLSHRILAWNRKFISENLYNPHVNIVYLACDCSNIPIIDNAIDCITSNAGFESMQDKTILGFKEAYRILKLNGYCIYDMSLVEDLKSDNTKKWIELYNGIEDKRNDKSEKMIDLNNWQDTCKNVGFKNKEEIKVYGELPAPDSDVFPWENMILRWMCCYVFVSIK